MADDKYAVNYWLLKHSDFRISLAVLFFRFKLSFTENLDDSFHLKILKEALLRAIHDIDASFSKASHVLLVLNF